MIIATTHTNTDFDGLASILAASLLYDECVAVCPNMTNPNVQRFLALHKSSLPLVLRKEVDPEKISKLIVVDTNQWRRLGCLQSLKKKDELEIILWDHHKGPGDIAPHWQCVEETGAAITLFVREIKQKGLSLSPLLATVFLLGLYEDTGQLTFSSTTPEDARAAAFLLEQGADLTIAVEFMNMAYDETQKKVLFQLMRDGEEVDIKGHTVIIGVVRINRQVKLAMVVQLYRKIVNADAVFIIFVNGDGSIFIIGRSGVPVINVHSILTRFGGAGHPGAGAATIQEPQEPPGRIRQRIIEALKEDQPGEASVADMMSFPVTTVPPDTTMHKVRCLMEKQHIRGIVVADEQGMVGIIVLWDLKKLSQDKQWNSPVKAFMKRDVTTISPDALASEAAELMVRGQIGHLPVVQENEVIGIVTRTDVVNYLYGMLPD